MSRKEDIANSIWSDPDFEDLSLEATVLYLWSWTNPRCGMAGLYKVSKRAMCESKVAADRLEVVLKELADKRFAFYQDGVMFVRTRVKHLRQKTPQIAKAIGNDLVDVADDHPLKARFVEEYGSEPWLYTEGAVTVTGGSTVGRGFGSIRSFPGPYSEGHSTLLGKGKGTGKGNGSRGRGPGRGQPDNEPQTYEPDHGLRAIAAVHFPGSDPVMIENTGIYLRSRGIDPSPTALRNALSDIGALPTAEAPA